MPTHPAVRLAEVNAALRAPGDDDSSARRRFLLTSEKRILENFLDANPQGYVERSSRIYKFLDDYPGVALCILPAVILLGLMIWLYVLGEASVWGVVGVMAIPGAIMFWYWVKDKYNLG